MNNIVLTITIYTHNAISWCLNTYFTTHIIQGNMCILTL